MKKLVICLLVCLVVSSSVFALKGTSEVLSNSSAKEEAVAEVTTSQPQQKTSSSTKSEKTSSVVSKVQTDLENKKSLKGDALEEHKENLQELAEDYAKLAKYRNSVRPFVNGGLRLRFKEKTPIFGVQASGGIRFSSGVTVGATIGYELLEVKEGLNFCKFGFNQWDAALTVGYNW